MNRVILHLTYNCSWYGCIGDVRYGVLLLHYEHHGVGEPEHGATHGVHNVQHTLDILEVFSCNQHHRAGVGCHHPASCQYQGWGLFRGQRHLGKWKLRRKSDKNVVVLHELDMIEQNMKKDLKNYIIVHNHSTK